MTTISSNVTALSIAEETTLNVLPGTPVFQLLEPNSYSDLGGEISVVPRNPISPDRQRRRGTLSDSDAMAGWNSDFTRTNMLRYLQGFLFADAREKGTTAPMTGPAPVVMTATTATTFTAAAGLGIFAANVLVFASGFAQAANNGFKLLSAATATVLTTTGNVVEAAPPAIAKVEAVGRQFASGDLVITVASGVVTMTSTASALPTNLVPGEWIYIGGDTLVTQFATFARGMVRLRTVSAGAYTFDDTILLGGVAPVADAGAAKTIQIFFGTVIRNEFDPTLIKRRTYTVERQMGIGSAPPNAQAEYISGCVPNELTFNFPGQDKVTTDITFVGMTSYRRSGNGAGNLILTGTRLVSTDEEAYNTTQDFKFQKLTVVPVGSNGTPLFAFATDATIAINNNVDGDKALGVLGAINAQPGTLEVGGTINAYFTTVEALDAVQNNAEVAFTTGCVSKRNFGFIVDLPMLQLANGKPQVSLNDSIIVPLDLVASRAPKFGHTILINSFPYLPSVAAS